jgi:putative drug exporter of the RND superfamily
VNRGGSSRAAIRARRYGPYRPTRSAPPLVREQFGIGLAAGIIFDATVIRALLVPSLMRLLGRWNWWMPAGIARVLRTRPSPLPDTS